MNLILGAYARFDPVHLLGSALCDLQSSRVNTLLLLPLLILSRILVTHLHCFDCVHLVLRFSIPSWIVQSIFYSYCLSGLFTDSVMVSSQALSHKEYLVLRNKIIHLAERVVRNSRSDLYSMI